MKKITTPEMETVLADHFNSRVNLVVPNVSWGFFSTHEADLLVMTKAGFLYEVEIKVSMSDLKRDAKKPHGHKSDKVKYLYFAVPDYLAEKALPFIPQRAGVLSVSSRSWRGWGGIKRHVEQLREPQLNRSYKLNDSERFQIARLGALRIWPLKHQIVQKKIEDRNE